MASSGAGRFCMEKKDTYTEENAPNDLGRSNLYTKLALDFPKDIQMFPW